MGFRTLGRRDPARRFEGDPRPVSVACWYPAGEGGRGLTYADYVAVSGAAATLEVPTGEARAALLDGYRGFLESNGLPRAGVEAWLASPMAARAEAPEAPGRYPVVLIAPGNGGAVQDQAVLGETLASHGFVVLTTPSPARLGFDLSDESDVRPMAEEEARDLEQALEAAADLPGADRNRVGVVGYSFGARAALLLALRRGGLKALVSLDGGIGSGAAKGWLSPDEPGVRELALPILHVYAETDPSLPPDFDLLDALERAPRLLLRVDGMGHLDAISFGPARAGLPALGLSPADAGALASRVGAVFGFTLEFLRVHVAGRSPGGLLGGDPTGHGFPPGLLSLTRLEAGAVGACAQ